MHLHQLQKILRFPKTALKRFVSDLLRLVLLSNRPRRMAQAGFVLPTTVLLALMVVLTATALTYRTFTRSEQAIVQREQQVITNAATPAIDRAKAKIEFLFRNDPRFPSGIPASDILYDLMSTRLETGKDFVGYTGRVPILQGGDKEARRGITSGVDPYTLADETRIDINNDGLLDNAWSFPSGGQTIVYSILVDDAVDATEKTAPPAGQLARPYVNGTLTLDAPANQAKANSLITRTAPLATTEASPLCKGAVSEGGWQVVSQGNASSLQKNFQVDAFVASGVGGPGQTFETLEFQQSRQASRASKWGAWFRYDLEIFPGAAFNWNGAMHTDGNLIIDRNTVQLHMVSSHNSCVYSQESSEISLSTFEDDGFQGQAVKGATRTDNYPTGEAPIIHVYDGANKPPVTNLTLTHTNHSVERGKPSDISVNAMTLFTQDRIQHMAANRWNRRPGWDTAANRFGVESGGARIINNVATRPFVDDFYRADNRWGPKPRYDSRTPEYDVAAVSGRTIGDPISNLGGLTDRELGLDGYWERQAIRSGLRLIVGQRLELGNNDTWNKDPLSTATPNPPNPDVSGAGGNLGRGNNALYPSLGKPGAAAARHGGNHEYLQRRSLQDNLAAVQGMVVYHYQGGDPVNTTTTNGEFPAACVALTAHPGTRQSIVNSRTIARYPISKKLRIDFLNGLGTNGWEFTYPTAFNTEGKFGTQLRGDRPLGIALRNLANFAGDPGGGAPSFKAYQDTQIHPFPYHDMWGDFSPLRRVLMLIDTPSAPTSDSDALSRYNTLSFADKATLHSAACTLSMLANNIKETTAEYEALLKDYPAPKSLQNVTTGGSQIVSGITNYLVTRQDPKDKDFNKYTGNNGATKQIQDALAGLPSGNRNRLWVDPNPGTAVINPKDGTTVCTAAQDGVNFEPACDSYEFFKTLTFDDWVYLLNQLVSSLKPSDITDLLSVRFDLQRVNSLLRDRDLGFRDELSDEVLNVTPSGNSVFWNPTTGLTDPVTTNGSKGAYIYGAGCNPNIFSQVAAGGGGGKDNVLLGALIACSFSTEKLMPVRFPSLFYLFPLVDHGIAGNVGTDNEQPRMTSSTARATKPSSTTVIPGDPEYVTNVSSYITSSYSSYGATAPTFRVVQDPAAPNPRNGLDLIAAEPKLESDLTKWTLPVKALTTTALATTNVDDPTKAFQIDYVDSTGATKSLRVPFLDKALLDGREQLNVRVLDMDVELLTTEKVKTGTTPDYWLTADRDKQAEGVLFAFREDAVREDEIVRPQNSTASDCTGMTTGLTVGLRIETVDQCQMRVTSGLVGQDPPLTAQGISIKPVDFIADPERRPHGFRLRTFSGAPADFSGTSYARKVGMTFVTDNAVYIQGDFNLHTEDGTASKILEEFTQTLWNDNVAFGNPFYNSRTKAGLNTAKFAVLEVDHWRPVELLSDAITILSKDFKDGAVEDGFRLARPNTEGGGTSSYMNQNRPTVTTTKALVRSQIDTGTIDAATTKPNTVPATVNAPPFVDRNGSYFYGTDPFYTEFNTDARWTNFDTAEGERRRNLQKPSGRAFVNATFVSGIVPKRAQQSYGGLHNYPRFIEDWDDRSLFISGSFIQLNFSTGSTGPYEQDAWEADTTPNNDQVIGYYNAPIRRWGYDVGLLYVPPAPAARRFVTIGAPRSEYYRELPADDPYVINLRCAKDKDGKFIFDGLCPA